MSKFTLYSWRTDDEGGNDVCLTENFNSSLRYDPYSGWQARPSIKIGEFNNIDELTELLFKEEPELYTSIDEAAQDAKWMYENYSILKDK